MFTFPVSVSNLCVWSTLSAIFVLGTPLICSSALNADPAAARFDALLTSLPPVDPATNISASQKATREFNCAIEVSLRHASASWTSLALTPRLSFKTSCRCDASLAASSRNPHCLSLEPAGVGISHFRIWARISSQHFAWRPRVQGHGRLSSSSAAP